MLRATLVERHDDRHLLDPQRRPVGPLRPEELTEAADGDLAEHGEFDLHLVSEAEIKAKSGQKDEKEFEIPAGSIVFVSPYIVHRHPRMWDDPEGFDPHRFEKEPPRGAYFPFGGGPRACIGNGFAMMEAQLVLATIAQRVKFELVPGHPVELEPSITLRPRFGLMMQIGDTLAGHLKPRG